MGFPTRPPSIGTAYGLFLFLVATSVHQEWEKIFSLVVGNFESVPGEQTLRLATYT